MCSSDLAQCSKPRRDGRIDLNLPLEAEQAQDLAWIDLVVAHATHDPDADLAVGIRGNRLRQLKAAFDSLAQPAIGLMELPRSGSRTGKYDDLRLMNEAGARETGAPLPYRLPAADEPALNIPAEFWLNGWVHLMTDSEIAAWLMFRDANNAPDLTPSKGDDGGYFVTGGFRLSRYCLGKEVWNSYQMLVKYGLLKVDKPEGRRADGTYEDYDPRGGGHKPPPHRFWITDEGLNADASHAVPAAVAEALEWDAQLERPR